MGSTQYEDVLLAAADFEGVVKSSEEICAGGDRLAQILSLFVASGAAFSIRECLQKALGAGLLPMSEAEDAGGAEETLPTMKAVHEARIQLIEAVAASDASRIIDALELMRVFALSAAQHSQLSRMARLADEVSGGARLAFLVQLSLFAVYSGNRDAGKAYADEAWTFRPTECELYNLCMLEGIFALGDGKTAEAIQWLDDAISACQVDEYSLLTCGSRPPSFALARELLAKGERKVVMAHLRQCKDIWQISEIQNRLDIWVQIIEQGGVPDFRLGIAGRALNLHRCRLDRQWTRVRLLRSRKTPSACAEPKSREQVLAGRRRLRDDIERHISATVDKAISYLDE
jgi:hypothetical protein